MSLAPPPAGWRFAIIDRRLGAAESDTAQWLRSVHLILQFGRRMGVTTVAAQEGEFQPPFLTHSIGVRRNDHLRDGFESLFYYFRLAILPPGLLYLPRRFACTHPYLRPRLYNIMGARILLGNSNQRKGEMESTFPDLIDVQLIAPPRNKHRLRIRQTNGTKITVSTLRHLGIFVPRPSSFD